MESKITPREALQHVINSHLGIEPAKKFVDEHYAEIFHEIFPEAIDKAEEKVIGYNETVSRVIKDKITEETVGLEAALEDLGMLVWHTDSDFYDHMQYIMDTKKKIEILKELLEELKE